MGLFMQQVMSKFQPPPDNEGFQTIVFEMALKDMSASLQVSLHWKRSTFGSADRNTGLGLSLATTAADSRSSLAAMLDIWTAEVVGEYDLIFHPLTDSDVD
eukprot:TRINITY_DN47127_c0_g1_i1.p1 TRINITY_DN47127_c0_g1~~TRINITY_DN47127_c0_g1_i1.p1  ORF type:complete len:101 (-),score=9.05 TRINITY_DN47127_c0_g1_i1:62-364(-)